MVFVEKPDMEAEGRTLRDHMCQPSSTKVGWSYVATDNLGKQMKGQAPTTWMHRCFDGCCQHGHTGTLLGQLLTYQQHS
eukprot:5603361-Amphidinium_carterae.1